MRPCRRLISIATWFTVGRTRILRDDLSRLPTVEVRLVALRDRREGAMVVLKVVGERLTAAHCREQRPAASQHTKVAGELAEVVDDDGGSLVGPCHSLFHRAVFCRNRQWMSW